MTGRVYGDDRAAGALAYCLAALRREDRDRYLTVLLAPRAARPTLAALYAFNLECAHAVTAGAQQPLLGQIRLQWWRDGLAAGPFAESAENRTHPVLAALAGRAELVPRLHEILAARERDLTDSPFATLADVVTHGAATGGLLTALAVQAVGGQSSHIEAGQAAGTAYALAGLLRAIPYQRREGGYQGRLCLPQELLARHGLGADDVWAGNNPVAVAACVRQVAAAAERELEKLVVLRANPGPLGLALSPLLHGSLARAYLHRLAKASHNPFARDLGLPPLARPLLLCWRTLLRRP
jgi:phytoene synthase